MENEFGEQPIKKILEAHQLKPHDIVAASTEQITHKMIAKAIKGRRLTMHVRQKILTALNKACQKDYTLADLFNYS